MVEGGLAGVGVLVTRPEHQAEPLVAAIEAAGGRAIRFPAIEVAPLAAATIEAEAAGLHDPDIAIFVSANAVRYGLGHAVAPCIAAVGPATAAAIEAAGAQVNIRPQAGFDSEHLLAEPEFEDVAGKVVRIIRGESGRELLAETLRKRGATVEYLAVYSRRAPQPDAAALSRLEEAWLAGDVDAVTVMSVETLVNLVTILPETCRDRLRQTLLVTPAERVIIEATKQFTGIPTALAAGTSPKDIVRAIAQHVRGYSE
jgi:uroporphyrinogen-III synthase